MLQLLENETTNAVIISFPGEMSQNDFLDMRSYFESNYFNKNIFNIIIDCGALTNPPSIAYGVFCSLTRDSMRKGGRLCFTNINPLVKKVMDRIHVTEQINIFENKDDAISSYQYQ